MSEERLYRLLPALYRVRDAAQGEPLRALLGVLEREVRALETDVEGLYEDWFIETCREWVVPYIGDLLGVRGLHAVAEGGVLSQRAWVANTLAYRRRKGTAAVLEQLARDVTGWPARVIEFFQLLACTQHVNHRRPANVRTPDLRDAEGLELLGGPFETAPRTAEVRHVASGRGRYNIPHVGLFLWRLQSYAVTRGTARAVADPADGRHRFHPLGHDAPLVRRPRTESGIAHLAQEANVPGLLRRRALWEDLEAVRQAIAEGRPPASRYFPVDAPVFEVFVDDEPERVAAEQILICDLEDWRRPPASRTYIAAGASVELPIRLAVDPARGRLAFPDGVVPGRVEVSYASRFSADLGGGPYDRRDSLAEAVPSALSWSAVVSDAFAGDDAAAGMFRTLSAAIERWNAEPPGRTGVVAITDSRSYVETLTGDHAIRIPARSSLLVVAAGWPEPAAGASRDATRLTPSGLRPHLRGDVAVQGVALPGEDAGTFVIDGLLVEGRLTVLAGDLGALRIAHCTLAPDAGNLVVEAEPQDRPRRNARLAVTLSRSIAGSITLAETVASLALEDSIVGVASSAAAVDAPGTAGDIRASTILGTTALETVEATDSLFTGAVTVARRQIGCLRFSYVPAEADGSRTPRRYRCQPDLALEGVDDAARQAAARSRLTPVFSSERFHDPDDPARDASYGQLAAGCADEILTGAEDGSEMGALCHLKQPQREANLRAALDEYLRFGLEAGILFVT